MSQFGILENEVKPELLVSWKIVFHLYRRMLGFTTTKIFNCTHLFLNTQVRLVGTIEAVWLYTKLINTYP